MTAGTLPELLAGASTRLTGAHELVAAFARLESPTGDAAALDAFTDMLEGRYHAAGAEVRRVASAAGSVLVADFPGQGARAGMRPALVLGHHDTVHPHGSLTVRDEPGVLHGPGVYDMKGGLVVAELALDLLRDLGWEHRPVRIVVTPDEEVGSPHSGATVVANADGAEYVMGFEPPHADGSLKTARHGSTRIRIVAAGRASHAALAPHDGVNAIDELCDQLIRVRNLLAAYPDVLVNVGTIVGGGRTNVVPESAHAEIGLRFRAVDDEENVLAALSRLEPFRDGAAVETVVLTRRPVWAPTPATARLMDAVTASARAAGLEITGSPSTGAADTNLVGALGLPTLDGFGPLGGGAHAVDEHIVVGELASRIALVAAVLHRV